MGRDNAWARVCVRLGIVQPRAVGQWLNWEQERGRKRSAEKLKFNHSGYTSHP